MTLGTGGLDDSSPVLVSGTVTSTETNAVLTAVEDQTTHYLAVKELILNAIEDTIAHTIGVQVKGVRPAAAGCFAHRSSLTAPDLVAGISTAPAFTNGAGFADATANPSSALSATAYYGAFVIRNGMGVTLASGIATVTPTAGHMVRLTIPAAYGSSLSDTDLTYEIFMSADAIPKHVATFTGAQLAVSGTANHGCYVITAETPVTTAADARAAWAVDIGVVGTGLLPTNAMFATSTAYELGSITPVATTGYNNADVYVDAIPTAYSVGAAAPSLTLIPVFLNDKQAANYHVGAPIYVNLLGGVGQSFRQVYNLTTNGASVIILVASITNVTVNRIDITPTSVV